MYVAIRSLTTTDASANQRGLGFCSGFRRAVLGRRPPAQIRISVRIPIGVPVPVFILLLLLEHFFRVLLAFLDSICAFLRILDCIGSPIIIGIELKSFLKSRERFGIVSEPRFGHSQLIKSFFVIRFKAGCLTIVARGFFILM